MSRGETSSNKPSLKDISNNCGNGSSIHVYKCKSKRCLLNKCFSAKDKAVSSASKRLFDCIVPAGSSYIDCHSANVIYLITCNNCHLQYVGETVQKLNERFGWHRSGFKYPDKYGFCEILTKHFLEGLCKDSTYNVQILEKLEGNGRTERGAMDASSTSIRKKKEVEWMMKLRTVYPYGLNDRIGDEHKCDSTHVLVGTRFPPLARVHPRLSRGEAHCKINYNITPLSLFNKFSAILNDNISETSNFMRISLMSMKKSHLKSFADILYDEIAKSTFNQNYLQWHLTAIDIIESKIYKPPVKFKRKAPSNICKIVFENKGIEMINLSRIFHDKVVINAMPSFIKDLEQPTVVYELSELIRSKIFNFNSFVSNLDIDAFS